jgi:hypothetical protein
VERDQKGRKYVEARVRSVDEEGSVQEGRESD